MDIRQARESAGVSQRDLSEKTGISQATLSRIESGEREATDGEIKLVDIALAGTGLAPPAKPPESQVPGFDAGLEVGATEHAPKPGLRRAYICTHKDCKPPYRRFLRRDEPDEAPDCPWHGSSMQKQENRPYKGQATT